MMLPDVREAFMAWSETPQHADAVAAASAIIADSVAHSDKAYVAYSGGKDSLCLLHLVLQHAPDTMVYHWDFGRYKMPREAEAEVVSAARTLGTLDLRIDTSERYETEGRAASHVFEEEFFGRSVNELAQEGYDLAFIGLRKQEGVGRRLRIMAGKSLGPIRESWPLADWDWRDVWAYIATNELPYPSAYDSKAPLVGWDKARFSSFFDRDLYHLGTEQVDNVLYWRLRNVAEGGTDDGK